VQNWNEGKSQEYKNRKLYDIGHSVLKKKAAAPEEAAAEVSCEEQPMVTARYLFTTKTCPNCAMAKEMLSGEDYILVDAEEEVELTRKYGVMQAPTLVVLNGDQTKKYVNASNIRRYMETK
jgi:ribonucleoside-triphosphate reductase